MADDAVFAGPKGKGPPTWLIIGGLGVGAVALVMILSKSAGGGGTTAAGASINAGLGSLQEEQQNLLGTIQAGQLQNNANFSSLGGQLADTQNNVLAAITAQGVQTGQQIQSAIDQVNQNTNTQSTTLGTNLAAQIQAALQQLISGQAGITGVIQSESAAQHQQISDMATNIATNQQNIIKAIGDAQGNITSAITQQISGLASIESAQYAELMGVQVDPWMKQWYQNSIVQTLTPFQQEQFWNLTQQQAMGTPGS